MYNHIYARSFGNHGYSAGLSLIHLKVKNALKHKSVEFESYLSHSVVPNHEVHCTFILCNGQQGVTNLVAKGLSLYM